MTYRIHCGGFNSQLLNASQVNEYLNFLRSENLIGELVQVYGGKMYGDCFVSRLVQEGPLTNG